MQKYLQKLVGVWGLDCVMSFMLHVSLTSGKTVSLRTDRHVTVEEFKQSAKRPLSVGRATLITSCGRFLDGASTMAECDLRSGDSVIPHVRQPQILTSSD